MLAGWVANHARSRDQSGARRTATRRHPTGRACPATHVLFAPGDEGRASESDPRARWSCGPDDDAALHAPESRGNGRRDPVARRTTLRARTARQIWRYFDHSASGGSETFVGTRAASGSEPPTERSGDRRGPRERRCRGSGGEAPRPRLDSGLRGSNPSNWLGKPGHYHYAKPARREDRSTGRLKPAQGSGKALTTTVLTSASVVVS